MAAVRRSSKPGRVRPYQNKGGLVFTSRTRVQPPPDRSLVKIKGACPHEWMPGPLQRPPPQTPRCGKERLYGLKGAQAEMRRVFMAWTRSESTCTSRPPGVWSSGVFWPPPTYPTVCRWNPGRENSPQGCSTQRPAGPAQPDVLISPEGNSGPGPYVGPAGQSSSVFGHRGDTPKQRAWPLRGQGHDSKTS